MGKYSTAREVLGKAIFPAASSCTAVAFQRAGPHLLFAAHIPQRSSVF